MKCLRAPLVKYQKTAAILWKVRTILSFSSKNNVVAVLSLSNSQSSFLVQSALLGWFWGLPASKAL